MRLSGLACGALLLGLLAAATTAQAQDQDAYGAMSRSPLLTPANNYRGTARFIVPADRLRDPPYNAIFKLVRTENGHARACVAAAVDPHILLTAAHCVLDADLANARDLVVIGALYRDFRSGSRLRPRIYWVGMRHKETGAVEPGDCAILYLPQAPPWEMQPFALDPGGACPADMALQAVGYSNDVLEGHALLHDPLCWNHRDLAAAGPWKGETRVIFHDCSLGPGSSGAPLFCVSPDRRRILTGINSAEQRLAGGPQGGLAFSAATTNVAVDASGCYAKVEELKALLRQGLTP